MIAPGDDIGLRSAPSAQGDCCTKVLIRPDFHFTSHGIFPSSNFRLACMKMNSNPLGSRVRASWKQVGFTLIELMVVLAIIGMLAALIVPSVLGRADDARVTSARTDVGNLMQALKLYKLDNRRFPTTDQGLRALVIKPETEPMPSNWRPYLDKLPNDPWGNPFLYMNPGIKGEVDVLSFGADGKAGGEGNDADIGSWQ